MAGMLAAPAADLQAKAQFLLRLRAKGVRDLGLLRAVEAVAREAFVPHRYADLAARDIALPLPCGQTLTEPLLVAQMIEALALAPTSRVLEIGTGSGYGTAILARLAADVVSFERYRSLAAQARARMRALDIRNATVHWADGLAPSLPAGGFDRLIVHAVLEEMPAVLDAALAPDALVILARRDEMPDGRQRVVRLMRRGGSDWSVTLLRSSRLRPLQPGMSAVL